MSVRDVVQAAAGVGGAKLYVEDVFSTYLYTGNGSTQTITNGIDLAGEGGLVWIKDRNLTATHGWFNTVNGATKYLQSNSTTSQNTDATTLTSFNSNGFSIGSNGNFNSNTYQFSSWTFRKQAKFFDVLTYTGNSVAGRQISHNLGSVPGCIIIKSTSNVGTNWAVYHRSIPNTDVLLLNSTSAKSTNNRYWNNTTPTSTVFTVGDSGDVNNNGWTYTAYLFAHNAGGFGDDGLQDIISCGSFNANSGNADITLGWEPQYVLFKDITSAGNWYVYDSMRGMAVGGVGNELYPNLSATEASRATGYIYPTSTGFHASFPAGSDTCIYIAIRRPMKTPESGSEVFAIDTRYSVGSGGNPAWRAPFPVDMSLDRDIDAVSTTSVWSRLQGLARLITTGTNAEIVPYACEHDYMNGWGETISTDATKYSWMFKRAPGFFDVVAYTGDGVAGRTVSHNLGVTPELMIVKSRSSTGSWRTYNSTDGNTKYMDLQSTYGATLNSATWNDTTPTSSVFTVGINSNVNASGVTYVAYLFASLPGVSKVGSYTGNGSSQTINCGFSAGARFVLIKRTDSTGDWYVWDTARGIVSANDPHLSLNTTAAQVTTDDSVDPDSTGFIVNQVAATNINVSSASYIYLAIA